MNNYEVYRPLTKFETKVDKAIRITTGTLAIAGCLGAGTLDAGLISVTKDLKDPAPVKVVAYGVEGFMGAGALSLLPLSAMFLANVGIRRKVPIYPGSNG